MPSNCNFRSLFSFLVLLLLPNVALATDNTDISDLLDTLTSHQSIPDSDAYNQLVKIGTPAVEPTMLRLQNEKSKKKQEFYLMLLLQIGTEDIADRIIPFTESSSGNVREWAIFVLSKIGGKSSIGALVRGLSDSAVEPQAKVLSVSRLEKLTGQKIPYTENMNSQDRLAAAKQWTAWWENNAKKHNN